MRIRKAALAAGIAVLCAVPSTASAETVHVAQTAASVQTCQDPETSQLLAGFGDLRSYFVAPGGDFESGADGWQLEGGAVVVRGSSELGVLAGGSQSLALPAGASATSPEFCVDERYPTFRMATAQLAKAKGKVDVQMVYPDLQDNVRDAGELAPKGGGWHLTDDMAIEPAYGTAVGGWRKVALRFTVVKADSDSDLRVDDVVIDPRMR